MAHAFLRVSSFSQLFDITYCLCLYKKNLKKNIQNRFYPGDRRSNQIITLTTLHTIFAREHNRIAAILYDLNHHWSDERIFYETRQIVIAKLQHIIYSEWLPYLIGK